MKSSDVRYRSKKDRIQLHSWKCMRCGDIMAIVFGREGFPARNYIVTSECAERVEQNIYAGIIVMKRNRESSPRIICQVATVGCFSTLIRLLSEIVET